jgi:hypothetical protein
MRIQRNATPLTAGHRGGGTAQSAPDHTILVGMTEGGFGSPDIGQFQGFVGNALTRVR